MDQWRSYFAKSGADIWTVIEKAIILAATDFPVNFKEKRSEIAETLFARRLLKLHSGNIGATVLSGSVVTDVTDLREESEAKRLEKGRIPSERVEDEQLCCSQADAEALTDEMEEDTLMMKDIQRIKDLIADNEKPENVIFEALRQLEYMQITVEALKATEIGKQVNALRKHTSKRVRALGKQLVRSWREMVDDWVKNVEDVAAAAVTENDRILETDTEHVGLPSPPLDKGALLAARTTPDEMSQLFNLLDDDYCAHPANIDDPCNENAFSLKDDIHYSASRSIMTDGSEYDAKASTNRSSAADERGSTNRHSSEQKLESVPRLSFSQRRNDSAQLDSFDGQPSKTSHVAASGPGRPVSDLTKARVMTNHSTARSVETSTTSRTCSSSGDRSMKPLGVNKGSAKSQSENLEEKLEVSKRKLNDGYQLARDVKRQHTVQVLEVPDIPKTAQVRGKMNPPAQRKTALQSGTRRYA